METRGILLVRLSEVSAVGTKVVIESNLGPRYRVRLSDGTVDFLSLSDIIPLSSPNLGKTDEYLETINACLERDWNQGLILHLLSLVGRNDSRAEVEGIRDEIRLRLQGRDPTI